MLPHEKAQDGMFYRAHLPRPYLQLGASIAKIAMTALFAAAAPACMTTGQDTEASRRIDAPLLAPLGTAACEGEDADTTSAREAIARVRAMAGLPPLRCDAAAVHAASLHCEYIAVNHVLTHVQEVGKPAFSGVTFMDRLAAQSFSEQPSGEVLATETGADAIDDTRGLLNSVYHRAPFLRGDNTSFGYGHNLGCATIDFGRTSASVASGQPVIWPPDGARNVPTSFRADRESPSPMPGATLVGSPVMLIAGGPLAELAAKLEGPSGALEAVVITAASDTTGHVREGEAHLVPRAVLLPNTIYTATFTATFAPDGVHPRARAIGERVVFTTTFTTGSN